MPTHVSQIYSILPERRQNRKFFCFFFRRKAQDGDQCPCVADLHNTHYILPERRQQKKFFRFLLGEKPKMATNAHEAQQTEKTIVITKLDYRQA